MKPQTRQQIITIQISSNISRSKGNQTKKIDHLIEFNMSEIFLEKSCTKREGEDSPRHFHKKSKLNISLDQQSKLI